VLKIIYDAFPNVCVIASGSSSFDLANEVGAPLAGRADPFILYPLSIKEIKSNLDFVQASAKISDILITGTYPAIFNSGMTQAQNDLSVLVGNYLYKDVLEFEKVKGSTKISQLLQLLALQVGSEVSYSEIGQKLAMSHSTVSKYIDLLEKCFIIFKLPAFSKNPRNEISKSVKIYFYDLGIRNAVIQTFAPINLRTDLGAIWENFCILERKKLNQSLNKRLNQYFYRTFAGDEVDYIEEQEGQIQAYEFKYSKEKIKQPKNFVSNYLKAKTGEEQIVKCINKNNWDEFLL
jgi:predicted AAA+ superfamily ATPase